MYCCTSAFDLDTVPQVGVCRPDNALCIQDNKAQFPASSKVISHLTAVSKELVDCTSVCMFTVRQSIAFCKSSVLVLSQDNKAQDAAGNTVIGHLTAVHDKVVDVPLDVQLAQCMQDC